MTGFDDRILQNVASGAGGTAGTATHGHTLDALDTQTNRGVTSAYVGDSAAVNNTLLDFNTPGTYTITRRHSYTDSQAHLYNALKVLLCKKT